MLTLSAMHASATNESVFLSALSSTFGLRLVTAPTFWALRAGSEPKTKLCECLLFN